MKKITAVFIFVCLFTLNATASQYILADSERMDGNLVKCEDYIQNDGVIVGDSMFFCKTLNGGGAVGGDLLGVFGTAKVAAVIGGNLRCITGGLYLDGSVAKNVTAFGGTVQLRTDSKINGSVYLAGGDVTLSGDIGKTSYVAGRTVIIDGTIKGDIHVYTGTEGKLYINGGAVITGSVFYHGNNAYVSPNAQMADYVTYPVASGRRSPLKFALQKIFLFLCMALLAFFIHFFTKGFFFRCGSNILGSLRGTAKSFFWLLLFLLCFLILSLLLYFLVPFGLSIFFPAGVSLIFSAFFLFLWLFSVFPVACMIGRLMTKREGFFTMLLGYLPIWLAMAGLEVAALFQPLTVTASIFLWALRIILFLLGGGSIFLVLNKRIKIRPKKERKS